jgi:glycosyltransferase involved in cell wall biosynthesis
VGGVEKYVHNLVQKLPAYRFKITCLTPYESSFTERLRRSGAEVFVTAMDDSSPPWRSIQFTTELIRDRRIDLVHAHLSRAHVLAGLAGRLANTPVVATVHGQEINNQELGFALTTGTHLVVVCRGAYYHALSLGIPAERVTLIPNGVDTQVFAPGRGGGRFRRALEIPPDAPLVGFVGRLAWEKGPDQFVEVAEYVHRQRADVHFVMVGKGPMEEEVRERIEASGLEDHVHLAGLWENTQDVYPALNVLAQTSRVEGMPFVLMEAMACARPVVAIGVGAVAEMIQAGTTGLLAAPGDPAGMARALLKLLADPEDMRQMGQAARERVEELYDLENSIHILADYFSSLAARRLAPNVVALSARSRQRPAASRPVSGDERKGPNDREE